MIKLDRLVLNNVGPYRYEEGGNKIEINNTADSDYVFLHGSPTHGKTTFRNALSWLLCNRFSDSAAVGDKHSTQHEIADFINQNCIEHPDHEFYVKGELIDDEKNKRYVITKTITIRKEGVTTIEDLKSNPPNVTTHVKVTDLITGKDDPEPQEPERYLDNLFPARLLDYFFVSGNDVKERLERDDLASDFESILGLDKFNYFKTVLSTIQEETENKYTKHKKAGKEENKIIERKQKINKRLYGDNDDGTIAELKKTEEDIKSKEYIRDNAINAIAKFEEGSKIKKKLDTIRKNREDLQAENKEYAEWLREHSALFWKVYAYNHILKNTEDKPSIYKSKDSELVKSISNISDKSSFIFKSLDEKSKKLLISIHDEHEDKLDIVDDHCTSFDVYSGSSEEIKKRVLQLHKNRSKLTELSLDYQLATNELGSTNFKDPLVQKQVETEQKQLEGIQSSIDVLSKRKERLIGEIDVDKSILKECESNLGKIIDHLSSEEKKLYNAAAFLIPIIETSLEDCKKEYRDMFEKKCNEVFDVIKNQKNPEDYLKIDQDYKMIIMRPGQKNKNNQSTSNLERVRKSGSEGFIAASAVTLALSHLAIKDFPIVLDAPFEQGDHDDEERLINGWLDIKQQAIISFQKPKDNIESPLNYSELRKKFPQSIHFRIEKDPEREMSWFREIT